MIILKETYLSLLLGAPHLYGASLHKSKAHDGLVFSLKAIALFLLEIELKRGGRCCYLSSVCVCEIREEEECTMLH